jgi:hypothetical protein
MQEFVLVSGAARRLGRRPREISDAFYQGKLDDQRCPLIDGRRMIPLDYLPIIEQVLRRRGLPAAHDDERQHAQEETNNSSVGCG